MRRKVWRCGDIKTLEGNHTHFVHIFWVCVWACGFWDLCKLNVTLKFTRHSAQTHIEVRRKFSSTFVSKNQSHFSRSMCHIINEWSLQTSSSWWPICSTLLHLIEQQGLRETYIKHTAESLVLPTFSSSQDNQRDR